MPFDIIFLTVCIMPNPPQSQAFYSNARRSSTFLSELSKNVNNSKGFLFLLPIKFRLKKNAFLSTSLATGTNSPLLTSLVKKCPV
jgi:hypothetical protein